MGPIVAVVAILLLSAFNCIGVVFGKTIQNIFTIIKIGTFVIFVAAGFTIGKGAAVDFSFNPVGLSSGQLLIGFGFAFIAVSWAFDGWNNINYIAGEIKNPRYNLPFSFMVGTITITILYAFTNYIYLYALPINEMAGEVRITEKAATALFGNVTASLISAAVMISMSFLIQLKPEAEKIFINGHIITMDDNTPAVEAMAIGNGKIVDIGTSEKIKKAYSDVVDLEGKTVMPGIIKSHGHLLSLGQSFLELNLEVETFIPTLTPVQVERALELAIDECIKNGLTTVHEAKTSARMLEAFRSLKEKSRLKTRIYVMLDVTEQGLVEPFLKTGAEIDEDNLLTIQVLF